MTSSISRRSASGCSRPRATSRRWRRARAACGQPRVKKCWAQSAPHCSAIDVEGVEQEQVALEDGTAARISGSGGRRRRAASPGGRRARRSRGRRRAPRRASVSRSRTRPCGTHPPGRWRHGRRAPPAGVVDLPDDVVAPEEPPERLIELGESRSRVSRLVEHQRPGLTSRARRLAQPRRRLDSDPWRRPSSRSSGAGRRGRRSRTFPSRASRSPSPVARWLAPDQGAAARVNAELGLLDAEQRRPDRAPRPTASPRASSTTSSRSTSSRPARARPRT